ncbi:pseudouridine synthase [Psychrosphaera saromensis]|uniref:RNA pseudouridine synthase n=1 Tax=Psychrosphaera saromensis TaxID=716813 RepID=A0A2S7US35_9GAMM|nr:pseudouridine synthase [Psychrosphaera saromensis]PQJ52737.1 RNA pseudouridine synthase [Psychrosphaera saromensis]GHB70847.1 pseudouridine synthase [Psychrosphaera saromensis]GLQ13224.1 pseudouridine synthase [Psychrosphaera saromensis]
MQPQAAPFIVPKCLEQITIVYQDEHLLVINKPSGLLSLSGKHPLNKDSVHWRLVQDFPTATLIHRLDFGTSGLMLVALNKDINKQICEQFSQRTVTKYYEAILDGELLVQAPLSGGDFEIADQEIAELDIVKKSSAQKGKYEKHGEINIPIIKDADNFPLQKVCHQTGKQATSQYQIVSYNKANNTTKVLFQPITGRTHQLRIHSREIGHPIIGCDLYDLNQSYFKADRLMLHASRLGFTHPVTNQEMDIKLPANF